MAELQPRKRLTRAESKALTRARLLDAAAVLFARKGFGGASVEEIAEAAGYTIGAVYAQFGSKAQLMVELLSSRVSERVAEVAQIVEQGGEDDRFPMRALDELLTRVAEKNRDAAPLQAEFWLYAVRNPEVLQAFGARLQEPKHALAEVLDGVVGRYAPGAEEHVDALATITFALFEGLVRQRRIDPASVPDGMYSQALCWLFDGLSVEAKAKAKEVAAEGSAAREAPAKQAGGERP